MEVLQKLTIMAIILLVAVISVMGFISAEDSTEYIAGRYGKKCYKNGQEHSNIQYKIRFNTLEECQKYVRGKIK